MLKEENTFSSFTEIKCDVEFFPIKYGCYFTFGVNGMKITAWSQRQMREGFTLWSSGTVPDNQRRSDFSQRSTFKQK